MNVFSNYIPNRLIDTDNKDHPWTNYEIRNKIKKRDIFYQQWKKYKLNHTDFDVMNELISELSSIISQKREEYYFQIAKKLNDLQTNEKTYWSILKVIFNGRKIPVIPPLLLDGKLVSDFKEKVTDSTNFLVVSVHHLIMVVNIQVSLFLILIRDFPQLVLMIRISF